MGNSYYHVGSKSTLFTSGATTNGQLKIVEATDLD